MVRFTQVRLGTASAARMAEFWRQFGFATVLEEMEMSQLPSLPTSSEVAGDAGLMPTATITVGATRLKFEEVAPGSQDCGHYHYAFNIPEHRYEEAKSWLEKRVPLMPMETRSPGAVAEMGSTTVFFDLWDAHACYFRDPDGNITEFIARHALKENTVDAASAALPFSTLHLQCVSEVTVASTDVLSTVAELGQLSQDLQPFLPDKVAPNPFFCALGDDEGLVIVMKLGRTMLPTPDYTAEDRPVCVKMLASGRERGGGAGTCFQGCFAGVSHMLSSSESSVHQQVSDSLVPSVASTTRATPILVEGSGVEGRAVGGEAREGRSGVQQSIAKGVMLNSLRVVLEWE